MPGPWPGILCKVPAPSTILAQATFALALIYVQHQPRKSQSILLQPCRAKQSLTLASRMRDLNRCAATRLRPLPAFGNFLPLI